MRVAIVHDYLVQRGGAERVVMSMLKAFPEAELHTSAYVPELTWDGFHDYDVVQHLPSYVPESWRARRALAPVMGQVFGTLELDADVVIASSSGWAHWTRAPRGRVAWYCYTPPRWLHRSEQYFAERPAQKILSAPLRPIWRRRDAVAGREVAGIAGISTDVVARVAEVYKRPARVLFPPATILPEATATRERSALIVGRLVPYKRWDLAVEACLRAGVPLRIVGEGPHSPRLAALGGSTTTFLGRLDDDALAREYASAGVLLQPGEEDFGLTPVEAAGLGCRSVVFDAGGARDTVRPDLGTGTRVSTQDVGDWAKAIVETLATRYVESDVRAFSRTFGEAAWLDEFRSWVDETCASR